MKMQKLLIVALTVVVTVMMMNVALAAGAGGSRMLDGINPNSFDGVDMATASPLVYVGNLLQSVITLMGAVAVIMIIYAGVTYSTSKGDETKVKTAQKMIMYAIVGLVVIIASYSIVYWVTGAQSPLFTGQQTI